MVQSSFLAEMKAVYDKAAKDLQNSNLNETQRHILLYSNFEDFLDALGPNTQHLLRDGNVGSSGSVIELYKNLSRELTQAFIKSRTSLVSPQVSHKLRQTETNAKPGSPESDFQLFARRCVLEVFESCQQEHTLFLKFFVGGAASGNPLSAKDHEVELVQIRKLYIDSLYTSLDKHLKGDLER